MDDIKYWLAATLLPGIGLNTLHRCLTYFGEIAALFSAKTTALKAAGLTAKQCEAVLHPSWDQVTKILGWVQENKCELITCSDLRYPLRLQEIYPAPLLLYVQGNVDLLSTPQLAMVGSRHATPSGCESATFFAKELAHAGLVITSGLALGIDGASHRGALLGGKTIAVLGTGLAHIYPVRHKSLAEKILAEGGAIISEFPPWAPPLSHQFPLRNRIISGLSLGVLVVEAAKQSGSLITARYALDQNREVFAMPGSIHSPQSRGCHDLIRQGAKLVETVEDILVEINGFKVAETMIETLKKPTDPHELQVLQQIDYQTTARDVIIMRSGLSAAAVAAILLRLELSGWVEACLGGYRRVAMLK